MWISMKKMEILKKRVAELEHEVQIQRRALEKHLSDHELEEEELHKILNDIKRTFIEEQRKLYKTVSPIP
ncbi:hypothetical protein EUBC25_04880 [Claveliimonas bilis]|nr:hypothetical protein EUBC25_04880 [Claveliimonas bilis]